MISIIKRVDAIDLIQRYRFLLVLFISVVFAYLYSKSDFIRSIRLGVSDVVSISSIILGILGVFVGLLISLHDSKFFKKMESYSEYQKKFNNKNKKFNVFEYLLKLIRSQFAVNIFFIMLTILIDFVPSISNIYVKLIFVIIWNSLLLLTMWGAFYIVDIIIKIQLKNWEITENNTRKHVS